MSVGKKEKVNLKRLSELESDEEAASAKKTKASIQEEPSLVIQDVALIKNNFESRLNDQFFNEPCIALAKKLLGKFLVRKLSAANGNLAELCACKIVEVEAYPGGTDKASHSYNGKQTDRIKAMYMKPGTAYVYNIYGVYCCLNVSSQEPGGAVLIRALEPVLGIETIKNNRSSKSKSSKLKLKDMTSGPSKLCQALSITKETFNQTDLCHSEDMWLQDVIILGKSSRIVSTAPDVFEAKRIGIDYAGEEAVNSLYRFYVRNNLFVSVKSPDDKKQ